MKMNQQRLQRFPRSLPDDVSRFALGAPNERRWLGLTPKDDRANHAALMMYLRLAFHVPTEWRRITRTRGRAFTAGVEAALGLHRVRRRRPTTPVADRADVRITGRVTQSAARLARAWDVRQQLRAARHHDEDITAALRQLELSASEITTLLSARSLIGAAQRIVANELGLKYSAVRAAVAVVRGGNRGTGTESYAGTVRHLDFIQHTTSRD